MKTILQVGYSLLGTPYIYGGKSPAGGLDCSGLVSILLRAGGAISTQIWNAQEIHDFFNGDAAIPQLGALIFYATNKNPRMVHHVAFAIDAKRHLEAGGGDSGTLTPNQANAHRAYARITPIRFDSPDYLGCLLPDYPCAQV